MIDIISKSKVWLILSGSLVLISIIALLTFGLNLGIDFAGGSLIEISTGEDTDNQKIEEIIEDSDLGLETVRVQQIEENIFLIRTVFLEEEKHNQLKDVLTDEIEDFEEVRFENVGPTVGKDLQARALWSLIAAIFGIIIYIWWAFRKLPSDVSSFQFGIAAILALVHDTVIVFGLFSILGYFFSEIVVESYFIIAILTVIGFSVNDTIVVFDRLRENLLEQGSEDFPKIANDSINQSLIRSINMSLTLLFVLLAMYFLAGTGIKNLVLALIIGTIVGTYSSLFVAMPFVNWWHNRSA